MHTHTHTHTLFQSSFLFCRPRRITHDKQTFSIHLTIFTIEIQHHEARSTLRKVKRDGYFRPNVYCIMANVVIDLNAM